MRRTTIPERMAGPRLVFYAVNGLGLGHVTRLLAIARAVRKQSPRAEILFLTSSEADGVIYREGFAAVKIPSKSIREQCGLGKDSYLKLVQSVTWNALSAFNPDVLVVDTYPAGSFEELLPVLRWRQKNVFVFREQKQQTFQSALLRATLPLYDLLVVPHDDAARAGELPEPEKARAVGPILIRERNELLSRDRARATLGLAADEPLFYASFGGGGDPEARRALELTAAAIGRLPGARLVVAAGPLLREAPRLPASALCLHGRYPMLELLPAFDAAIAAAGYNTVHELLYAGIPSAFIPFGRVLDDQHARAATLSGAGAALCCAPLTEAGLGEAIQRLSDPATRRSLARRAAACVQKNGAGEAAQAILSLA